MEFIVSRASDWNGGKPCEEAELKTITGKTPSGIESICNHWVVEIKNLNDLMLFEAKYGSIIVGRYGYNPTFGEILIYDDYIE